MYFTEYLYWVISQWVRLLNYESTTNLGARKHQEMINGKWNQGNPIYGLRMYQVLFPWTEEEAVSEDTHLYSWLEKSFLVSMDPQVLWAHFLFVLITTLLNFCLFSMCLWGVWVFFVFWGFFWHKKKYLSPPPPC